MAFQLHDDEQVQLTVEALDDEGNAADAAVAFSSSDDTIAAVDAASGLVTASPGAAGLGAATITATVTDNGTGDVLTGTFDVEVIASDAVAVNFSAGAPTKKAPAAPAPAEPPAV